MDAQAKEIKNKVMCEINSFAIVYFFFDDRLFTVGKPRTDSVPPTMQSQIPKSRDVTLFFLNMTLYK